MTLTRTVAWIGGLTLAAAWLASAAGVGRQARVVRVPAPTDDAERVVSLAADVQKQAGRLRQRLLAAPAPQAPTRNPFAFAERRLPPSRMQPQSSPTPHIEPSPSVTELPLALIGIAEEQTAAGLVRTALVAGPTDDDLHMLTTGQTLADRYHVVTVGSDAVELRDLVTGAVRRLALK